MRGGALLVGGALLDLGGILEGVESASLTGGVVGGSEEGVFDNTKLV